MSAQEDDHENKENCERRHVLCVIFVGVALACLQSGDGTNAISGDRAAHYVLRSSDLNATLSFLTTVLGMHVLRHEENPQRCPITCNGPFNNAWSKTMVGYAPEHEAYALEITYNYGKSSYGGSAGRGLRNIRIRLDAARLARAPAAASSLGLTAAFIGSGEGSSTGRPVRVLGPDGYEFELMPVRATHVPEPPPPPSAPGQALPDRRQRAQQHKSLVSMPRERRNGIVGVTLRVSSRQRALRFYSALGFRQLEADRHNCASVHTESAGGTGAMEPKPLYLALDGNSGEFVLTLLPGPVIDGSEDGSIAASAVPEIDGRHAIAMRESMIYSVYSRVLSGAIGGSVVHELRELDEVLGKLVIAVVRDPDGHELCLVSSHSFDAATKRATDYIGPDWSRRAQNAHNWQSGSSRA